MPHINLSLPTLNTAHRIVFLITKTNKTTTMKHTFNNPTDPASPNTHMHPSTKQLLILYNPTAAKKLSL